MVKKTGFAVLAAAGLCAGPLSAAGSTYCYTSGGFAACASAAISVNHGLTLLEITVQNLSNNTGNTTYYINTFGLYYLAPPGYTGNLTLASGATNWINGVSTGLNANAPSGTKWLGGTRANIAVGPSRQRVSNWGLAGCGPLPNINPTVISTCTNPITFVFTLSNASNFNLGGLNFAFRGHTWTQLNGSSSGLTDAFDCYATNANCVAVTVTPEPATMSFIAIGLVGMGGAGLIGRRRNPAKR